MTESKKWCINCGFAKELTIAPSPSGPTDGVECANIEMAKEMDNERGGSQYVEEFRVSNTIHLWRGEVVDDSFSCPEWKPKP